MTLKSTLFPRFFEALERKPVNPDPVNGGIKVDYWFYGAAQKLKGISKQSTSVVAPQAVSAEQELNDIITKNPQISGATLINMMRAQGLVVSKKTEADSAASFAQVTRESQIKIKVSNLKESASDDGIGPTHFTGGLIKEGMGNFGDAYYYTRECLESAIPLFTGAKIYADHPTTDEEETRPERSVRDIIGHYENVRVEDDKSDGRAMLVGDVNLLPDKPYEWARALMRRTIEHNKKFPDKPFVGLSINAAGPSVEVPIDEVLKTAPESAKVKLLEAKEMGIDTVKVVQKIMRAISCDLVTEAGAGGKILNIIEGSNSNG